MIDWSILNSTGPVDISGNFARGYQMGSAIIDKMHERNALGTLARDPDNQSALASLYQVNPSMGAHFEERGQQLRAAKKQEAAAAQRSAILQQYATDPNAARNQAIAAGDFDLVGEFGKLDKSSQDRTAGFWEKAGPVAYQLKQIKDPAQRQAFWQQAKGILASEAVDPAMLEHFDPTNDTQLDAAIATSQKVSDLISQNKIEWHQQGESPSFATDAMGHPIGSANPALSGRGPASNVSAPSEAISYLKAHPDLASHFDEKYGAGAAASVLGGAGGNASGGFPTLRLPEHYSDIGPYHRY